MNDLLVTYILRVVLFLVKWIWCLYWY